MAIPSLPQSPDIGQNSDGGISDFQISGQSLIKRNCYNSRNTDDNDMKLGPVTKLDKINKATSRILGDDVISQNYDVIVIFLIYDQFRAVEKPDSGCIVCKTYIFIISNFFSQKMNTEQKNLKHSSHTIVLSKVNIFAKNADFFYKNNAYIIKIKRTLVLKSIISETKYGCILTCQISSFWHNSNKFWRGLFEFFLTDL